MSNFTTQKQYLLKTNNKKPITSQDSLSEKIRKFLFFEIKRRVP